jgi:hypothetical protein
VARPAHGTGSVRVVRVGPVQVGGAVAEAARDGGLERGQEPVHAVACGPGAARLPAGASAAVWRRRERAKG